MKPASSLAPSPIREQAANTLRRARKLPPRAIPKRSAPVGLPALEAAQVRPQSERPSNRQNELGVGPPHQPERKRPLCVGYRTATLRKLISCPGARRADEQQVLQCQSFPRSTGATALPPPRQWPIVGGLMKGRSSSCSEWPANTTNWRMLRRPKGSQKQTASTRY